ncbi:MAG: metallophosphoesterase family protein [Pleomorphochaeta sp.]
MNILCISDEKDMLVYSQHIKSHFKDIDLVIAAGDLSLRYYEFIISSLNKPLYFVFGNHNLEDFNKYMSSSQDQEQHDLHSNLNHAYSGECIEGKVIRDKKTGLIIAGLGGSYKYNKGQSQYTELEMRARIFKMIPKLVVNKIKYGRYLDILVTHASPLGYNDDKDLCHRGFASFLTFMDLFKPKYVLHGHIHLIDSNARRRVVYRQTNIINVYKSYVLKDDRIGDTK